MIDGKAFRFDPAKAASAPVEHWPVAKEWIEDGPTRYLVESSGFATVAAALVAMKTAVSNPNAPSPAGRRLRFAKPPRAPPAVRRPPAVWPAPHPPPLARLDSRAADAVPAGPRLRRPAESRRVRFRHRVRGPFVLG